MIQLRVDKRLFGSESVPDIHLAQPVPPSSLPLQVVQSTVFRQTPGSRRGCFVTACPGTFVQRSFPNSTDTAVRFRDDNLAFHSRNGELTCSPPVVLLRFAALPSSLPGESSRPICAARHGLPIPRSDPKAPLFPPGNRGCRSVRRVSCCVGIVRVVRAHRCDLT